MTTWRIEYETVEPTEDGMGRFVRGSATIQCDTAKQAYDAAHSMWPGATISVHEQTESTEEEGEDHAF